MKKFFILLLLTLLPQLANSEIWVKNADGVTILYKIINENELSVTSDYRSEGENCHYNYSGDIVIPEVVTYEGIERKVTSIGKNAFAYSKNLSSVTIPGSVIAIGDAAFSGCSELTSIIIPESVTEIGIAAFGGCTGLTSISIPQNVTSIGKNAFKGCDNIATVYVYSEKLSSSVFSECSSIKEVVIGESVKSIGYRAFYKCTGLTSLIIGNNISEIGEGAFSKCTSLTSITIPSSVTSFGVNVFMGCSNLSSVILSEGLTNTGVGMFNECTSLVSIDIPNSVTVLGASTFWKCSNLVSVNIPDGVTSIEYQLFSDCENLTSLTIPDGVTSIGEKAFYGCHSIASISIPQNVTSIGPSAFYGCKSLESIIIPEGVSGISSSAFCWCSGLKSVTLPNSTTLIANDAFRYTRLESITIPPNVSRIGYNAFDNCNLKTIILQNKKPAEITGRYSYQSFSDNTFIDGILYVPVGTKEIYRDSEGWKDFIHIEEYGESEENPEENDDPSENGDDPSESGDDPNTHEDIVVEGTFVDLGLPSGLLWATCNLGASSPEEIGGYYAWGEIFPKTFFSEDNYTYNIEEENISGTMYDAAKSTLGDHWRMPTKEEIKELADNCSRKEIILNGVSCLKFVGPNGNSLFIPKGGFGDEGSGFKLDGYGLWTATQCSSKTAYRAWEWNKISNSYKWQGIPIRPVTSITPDNKSDHKEIHVSTAGTLSSLISESEKYTIKKLTITGEINSYDFGFLRDMAGKRRKSSSMKFQDTEGKLESLDISGAKIVVGSWSVIIDDGNNDYEYNITRDNEIPPLIFKDCKNLTNISIPNNVYSIGSSAFHGTTWYENQPDGLVYIGNMLYAYKGDMPANTNVTIKEGTIGIACSAFDNCINLESVKIPNSVINIGGFNKYPVYGYDGVFNGCTGLKTIMSEIQNPPVFDRSTFGSYSEDIYSNAYLFVPTGTVDLYKSTEGWNNFTNIVDSDPTGIKNILYNEGKDTPAYDLNGRRLYQPQKGIKIQNGKKVVVK